MSAEIIRFEFHGGCKDGQVVSGDPQRETIVSQWLFLTRQGCVGARFREIPSEPGDDASKQRLSAAAALECSVFDRTMPSTPASPRDPATIALSIVLAELVQTLDPCVWFDGKFRSRDEVRQIADEIRERLDGRTAHVYEVTGRQVTPAGVVICVDFVGDDATGQLRPA